MNIVIAVGCVVEEPKIKKTKIGYQTYFRMATIEDDMLTTSPTYLNCVAYGEVAYHIYKRFKKGVPIIIRGRLLYNEANKANYVRVLYVLNLKKNENAVYMDMNEFIDIYKPENVLKNMQKEIKETKLNDKRSNDS